MKILSRTCDSVPGTTDVARQQRVAGPSSVRVVCASTLLMLVALLLLGLLSDRSLLNAQDSGVDPVKYGILPPESLSIISTRWYMDPHSKNGYDPAFSVTVQNLSQERIIMAILRVVIAADGGRHVLRREKFAHFLPAPLEPGQTTRWEIFPKPHGSPELDDYPTDTQVEVTVEKLFCPKKNGPHVHEFRWNLPARHDFAR